MNRKFKVLLVLLLVLPCMVAFSACKKKSKTKDNVFQIEYVLYGGQNNISNPTSYSSKGEVIVLLDATRENYTFGGWYKEAQFINKITQIEKGSKENFTLHAKWIPVEYTIEYELYGGVNNPDNPLSYNIETETFTLLEPTFASFDFEGWFNDALYLSQVTQIQKGSTGNRKFYAKWKDASYSIDYELYGGKNNDNNPSSYYKGTTELELYHPSRDGYNFDGWYLDANFENKIDSITSDLSGDLTLHAKWTAIVFNVRYYLVDGAVNENPASYTVENGDVTLLSPTKTGYNFMGWYDSPDFVNSVQKLSATEPKSYDLYALWEAKRFKIYFEYDGADTGDELLELDVYFDSEIGPLPSPSKTEYNFAGWWRNDVEYKSDTVYKFEEDITVTAKWRSVHEDLTFTVEFQTNGGSTVDSYTDVKFGDKIDKPQNPTKDGYIFDCWMRNGEEWDFAQNAVTENLVLEARWTLEIYTITYYLYEGDNDPENPSEYSIESPTIVLRDPYKEGFDFLGWFLDDDFSTPIEEITAGSHGNLNIYASYKKSEFSKSTADLTIIYNVPENLKPSYPDEQITVSIRTRQPLKNFNGQNIKNYFLEYYYYDEEGEKIVLEDFIYEVRTPADITIYADFDNERINKYYYTDGLLIEARSYYAEVTHYSGSESVIFIPEYFEYNGQDLVISKIGDDCFAGNYYISEVRFSNRTSAIEVGNRAFYNTPINHFDFTYVSTIRNNAFSQTALEEVVTSDMLVQIGTGAFENCKQLTKADFSKSIYLTTLGSSIFSGCESLSKINLSNSVNEIQDRAFANCTMITDLAFLEGAMNGTILFDRVFEGCTSITNIVIPANIQNIGLYVFAGCDQIKTIEISKFYRTTRNTFAEVYGLSQIEKITITGEGITTIPGNYFRELTSLMTFVMGNNITIVESGAFTGCTNLSDIQFSTNLDLTKFDINAYKDTYWYNNLTDALVIDTTLVYVPESESLTSLIVDSNITAISKKVASSNKYLTYIFIPSSVEIISSNAFSNCDKLKTVEFEAGSRLREISSEAFSNCTRLTSIDMSGLSNLATIGNKALWCVGFNASEYVNGDNGLVLPSSVTELGEAAIGSVRAKRFELNNMFFESDEDGVLYRLNEDGVRVEIIMAPNTITGDFYFIPSTIKRIGARAFYSLRSVRYIYIDHSISFGQQAFSDVTGSPDIMLKAGEKITFEDGIRVIFYELGELTENFEYSNENGEDIITITDDVKAGFYLIRTDTKIIMAKIRKPGDEYEVTIVYDDLTPWAEKFGF